MPQIMEQLDLKGTVIAADAMNTQKATAAKAIEKGADYVLPVKKNQPALLQDVRLSFEGFDREGAVAKAQWEQAVAKAEERSDEPRLQQLLSKRYSTCGASYWQEGPAKAHGKDRAVSMHGAPSGKFALWQGLGRNLTYHTRLQDHNKSRQGLYGDCFLYHQP